MAQYIMVEGACLQDGFVKLADEQPSTIRAALDIHDMEVCEMEFRANVIVVCVEQRDSIVLVRQ